MSYRIFSLAMASIFMLAVTEIGWCASWADVLAQAETQVAGGNIDSARVLFEQALTAAESQYGPSDSTVEVTCYPKGMAERVYFRTRKQAQETYSAFLSSADRVYGDGRPEVIKLLWRLGTAYIHDRQFALAEPVIERALSLSDEHFGENSLEVAEAMLMKGTLKYYSDHYSESESLFVRARSISEKIGGENHPLAAQSIRCLASMWRFQDRCAEADSILEPAIVIARSVYAGDSLELARFYELDGLTKYCLGDTETGDGRIDFVTDVWTEKFGMESEQSAMTLSLLAHELSDLGEYQQAESLLVTAFDIRRRLYGNSHPITATTLGNLGYCYWSADNLPKAESLYAEAVAMMEQSVGAFHPDYYWHLDWLVACIYDQGNYPKALALHERCLEIADSLFGNESSVALDKQWDIGRTLMRMGRFSDAESTMKRTVAGMRKLYGPVHKDIGGILTTLALCFDGQGRFDEAEATYREALDVKRATLPPDHPDLGYTTHDLGLVYWSLEEYEKAESHVLEALRLWKGAKGSHNYGIACGYLNLGLIYDSMRRYGEADSVLRLAIDLGQTALGPQHPALAHAYNNLANVHMKQGKYSEAEPTQLRAVSILEGALGPEHPEVAKFRRDLARILACAGKSSESLESYDIFIDWSQRFLENVFPYSSEAQKLTWMREYPLIDHTVFSVALVGRDARSRNVALEMLLKSKAMVIEAVMSERETAYCTADDYIIARLEKLNEIHTLIASLAMAGGSFTDSLKVLYGVKDSLEIDLSRHCGEFGDALAARRFEVVDVTRTIPNESVVWEIARYEPVDLSPDRVGDDKLGPERYLGFVLAPDGTVVIKDLGDAAHIDSLITSARDLIYKAPGQIYSPAAVIAEDRLNEVTGQLYDLVFASLAAVSHGKLNIYISPDGMLNLLPFEILPTPDGSYVIENYRISYLSSGRDLLKYKDGEAPDGAMIVMADPDFDGRGTPQASAEKSPLTVASLSSDSNGSDTRGIVLCLESGFGRLGHTRSEAQAVVKQLKATSALSVRELYDNEAVEDALKNLQAPPQVLHLATHGFFCETGEIEATVKDNPLLRSGLVLTGANRTISGERDDSTLTEDGILTALEVSGLNLVGTDLAVLSACESGMGDFVNGEGLFGLRRAFQHAGVETIVMSLWAVPDKETSQLMGGFYRRWLEGSSKRDALRKSALEVLAQSREKRGCGHPLLWGGFILAGNPN